MASYQRSLLALALVALFVNCAFAHTYLSSIFLNDQALSEGDCVRPHPDQQKEYPLHSVNDQDMTCGWLPSASRPANRKCPIAAGSKIGLQWYHNYAQASDFILESTHKGPLMVYLAKSETGAGNVWFKIYEDGFDANTGLWATDKLIANRGRIDITIPSDIAPGNYLLRGEVLALHNAYDVGGIQPYVGCVELTISGSGAANPSGVAFPGAYVPGGVGMMLNIYEYYNSYTIPGPAVYRSGTPTNPTTPTTAPTRGPTSPSGTVVNAGSGASITDQSGNVWAVTAAGKISVNGAVDATTANVIKLAFVNNLIWQQNNALLWWSKTSPSAQWSPAAGTTVSPLPSSTTPPSYPTYPPTSYPTYPPTTKPTTAPPAAPTTKPTEPTYAPTNAPTYAPTTAPTTPPSAGTIKMRLNQGSNDWWVGVIVSGYSETLVKVEIKDSKALNGWAPLIDMTYAYVFSENMQLSLPISVRLTSSRGKQVIVNNAFTSYSTNVIDSWLNF